MPDRAKVRWSQLKVGVIGTTAFAIVAALIIYLTWSKGVFQQYASLRTYVADASGIEAGTPVRLNGITIGYLDKLTLAPGHGRKEPVELDMAIRQQYLSQIPDDSLVGIVAANLLADKVLNITKGKSEKHLHDGDEVAGLKALDIPELLAESSVMLGSFQNIMDRLSNLIAGVEAGKGNLGMFVKDRDLYDHLNAIAAETQKLVADARTGGGTISKLLYDDSLYQDTHAAINRVNAIAADLQAGKGTAGKLLNDTALYDEARQTVTEMHGLMADLRAGKGTAGKLLTDEELYKRMNELSAKLSSTLDKINAGQGSIGQLMTNRELYDSLNTATLEVQSLMKDFRANPKKFLTIRLTLF